MFGQCSVSQKWMDKQMDKIKVALIGAGGMATVYIGYQEDVDRSLDSFVRLLEPIFIVILGGVVAGLMGAVLMPLYSTGLM